MKHLKYCNINSELVPSAEATISAFDESFLFGRGLFETIKIIRNEPLFLNEHLKRLENASNKLHIPFPQSEKIVEELEKTIELNDVENARLKIILSREGSKANLYIFLYELALPPEEEYFHGIEVGFSSLKKMPTQTNWQTIKTTNYLFNQVAREEAEQKGWYEGIFLDADNNICEGAFSNIFFINKGALYTPPVSSNILPGIIRQQLIKKAKEDNLTIYVKDIHKDELGSFENAFITNSIIGVLPIAKFGNHSYKVSDWLKKMVKIF
jgi:4-amino-4-deoxychorismate lyase